jgi:RimJ/RimL family protein N-acetyltransferase
VLADLWPLYGLVVRTPRLTLRVPAEPEIAALAELAGRGVHRPGERPFLTPWTEGSPAEVGRRVLRGHWGRLAGWEVGAWELGLGVFRAGEPLGMVTLRARDFAVLREVTTGSWLGLAHQGRGYGTEARAGLLALAFDHLGAEWAVSEVFPDNLGSQGVSRKLGYRPDGISRDVRGTEVLVSDRLRLGRADWRPRADVVVEGLRPELFGSGRGSSGTGATVPGHGDPE